MKNSQILAALKLPATTDNKQFAAKLEKIGRLITEVKKQPFYEFKVGPAITPDELNRKAAHYRTDDYFPKEVGSNGTTQVRSDYEYLGGATDLIDTFSSYQSLAVSFGDNNLTVGIAAIYTFDIPTGNAYHDYVMTLIGATVTPVANMLPAKKVCFRAVLAGTAIDKIKRALAYVSTDELRLNLCGVHLNFTHTGEVEVVGCDGSKLYKAVHQATTTSNKAHGFTLPTEACKMLVAVRRDANEPIELRISRFTAVTDTRTIWIKGKKLERNTIDTHLTFEVGTVNGPAYVSGDLIPLRYPQYNDVIPTLQTGHVTVDRKTLLSHIIGALTVANKTSKTIDLHFNGAVTVQAQDIDYARESKTSFVYVKSDIEDLDIRFNGKMLADILKGVKSETVVLEMTSANRAVFVTDPGSTDLRLLMPQYR